MESLSIFHGGLLVLVVGLAVYFVPAAVAFQRRHPHRLGIALLNVVLGWTVVGWAGALVWAFVAPRGDDGAARTACPECGESIMRTARVCRHCGHRMKT